MFGRHHGLLKQITRIASLSNEMTTDRRTHKEAGGIEPSFSTTISPYPTVPIRFLVTASSG